MDSHFKVSDLIYETHVHVPKEVIRKIEQYHLPILNELQTPIVSVVGYRSYQYEIMKGRPGTSQHTFTTKGAVDLVADDLYALWRELKETPYTRICFYGNFFHCDYKTPIRHYYVNKDHWVNIDINQMEDTIYESARPAALDVLYTIA